MVQIYLFNSLVLWLVLGKQIPICLHLQLYFKRFCSLGLQTGLIPLHFLLGFSEAIQQNRQEKNFGLSYLIE